MDESQHPIPQDITGFKFRLVGDITLKQFTYLAIGGGFAWFFYSLPILGLIKFPLIISFALGALALAFLPIQGRPADTMVLLFFKSVFKPNQYSKRAAGAATPVVQNSSQPIPQPVPTPVITQHEERRITPDATQTPIQTNSQPTQPSVVPAPQTMQHPAELSTPTIVIPHNEAAAIHPMPQTQPVSSEPSPAMPVHPTTQSTVQPSHEDLLQKIKDLEAQLAMHKNAVPITPMPQIPTIPTVIPEVEEKNPQHLMPAFEENGQKETQAPEITDTTEPIDARAEDMLASITPVPTPQPEAKFKIQVTQPISPLNPTPSPTTPQMPAHDNPNMIEGKVTDPRGNALPNILVEVKDSENNPVRAFKTSATGEFGASTPLLPGKYTVTFEDSEKTNTFETKNITIDNTIQPILLVTSVDEREKLRQELFT